MRQNHVSKSENGVSPVVGVMLMLVVTIVIAAVVAVFASGVISTTDKAPTILLKGTYSMTDGLTITHAGGDTIALSTTNFMTTPSEQMGSDANKYAYIISKDVITGKNITDSTNLVNLTSRYAPTAFSTGDTLYIEANFTRDDIIKNKVSTDEPELYNYLKATLGVDDSDAPLVNKMVNANAMQFWGGTTVDKTLAFTPYQFHNTNNIGKYFYLDLVDKTGSVISRAKVTITR